MKLPLRIRAHLMHGSLVPRVHTPNGISIDSAILAQLKVVTNRSTHRPCYMCNNRLHLCTVCMQCGLIRRTLTLNPDFEQCFSRSPSISRGHVYCKESSPLKYATLELGFVVSGSKHSVSPITKTPRVVGDMCTV